ncbi:MAG: peroxidase family protein [Hyphomicrobiaceae bacterium]
MERHEEPDRSIRQIRSFLRTPRPDERFSVGGRVEAALDDNPEGFRRLMNKLAARIARERWSEPIEEGLQPEDNPHIHAGYTYMLQLIAHDMVHSSVSLAEAATGAIEITNTRVYPLTLETIYGGGPDVCPQVYEFDRAVRENIDVIPRTRFRVGQSQTRNGHMEGCPVRDIARAIPAQVGDQGLGPKEKLELSKAGTNPWRTEALIADPRNDDHAIISQLAGLWQGLHNHILEIMQPAAEMASLPPAEQAYRRFFCARIVTTLIYRNIVREDVLPLILHPDINKLYSRPDRPHLDGERSGTPDGIPGEFLAGAFRIGHAMVRNGYRVNSDEEIETALALQQSSNRSPFSLPLNESWLIDWSRFFRFTEREPNYAHRIGPVYAGALKNSSVFPPLTAMDRAGLPGRDLVTAGYSDLWSVPALVAEIRSRGLEAALPDYSEWRDKVRAWLAIPPPGIAEDPAPFTPEEMDILAADPPLPLFILLEAAQSINGAPSPTDVASGESLHLGALGSIIVAETLYGALERTPVTFEGDHRHLRDRIAAASHELLGTADALHTIPEIATMSDLLRFMIAGGAVPAPITAR